MWGCPHPVRFPICFLQLFLAMEAMADGGVKMGMPRAQAYDIAAQTMIVSVKFVCP